MTWNWQLEDWPCFRYDRLKLEHSQGDTGGHGIILRFWNEDYLTGIGLKYNLFVINNLQDF